MKTNLAWLLCFFAIISTDVEAAQNKMLPAEYQYWQEVGRGEMNWLWWDLYQARLLTPDGQFNSNQCPMLLDISYLRDIRASDLIEATVAQWQHLDYAAEDITRWQQKLADLWPDVKAGDHLTFVCLNSNSGQFYHNGRLLKAVNSVGFSLAFPAIWLSENTSRPELRLQLMGDIPE